MPLVLRRLGRSVRVFLICLGALMVVVTVAPPRWYVNILAGPWFDPKAPVLIVLGGDALDGQMVGQSSYWRTIYAILAWKKGSVRRVVLSGESAITVPMRDYLVCQGIPSEAVTIEGHSKNTRENALFTAQMLKNIPGPYVLLTSDYHMWRASRAFAKAGVTVEPSPFPDALKRFGSWHERWSVFLELLQESGKIGYYRVRGWI